LQGQNRSEPTMKTHWTPYLFSLVACLAAGRSLGQAPGRIAGKSIVALRQEASVPTPQRLFQQGFALLPYPLPGFRVNTPWISAVPRSSSPVRAFSPGDLAFFCRLEFKLEKTLRFPLKIRLGEVQYVDQLEGK
jgi:hypothetical protein